MIYITGDTHRDFNRIKEFCKKLNTTKDDIMIILGDAGINYYGNENGDVKLKKCLETFQLPSSLSKETMKIHLKIFLLISKLTLKVQRCI